MSLPPFEQVVTDHGAAVLRVCGALVGRGEAEDLWSETFLAALAAYPRLRCGGHLRAWLLTIARNKAIDRARRGERAPVPVDPLPDRAAPASEPAHFDGPLWGALVRLAPKQRAAVAYRYIGDLPYAEVATLLGTSESAARRSAADGIASLRAALEHVNPEAL
ncbi:MAG: RNA polymerase sigma factor [Acidobacteriota bacterium]|nr:RNA polymerase sigma factor [Acidobacteriota bacterium]